MDLDELDQQLMDAISQLDADGVKAALNLLGFAGMRPRKPTDVMPADDLKLLER